MHFNVEATGLHLTYSAFGNCGKYIEFFSDPPKFKGDILDGGFYNEKKDTVRKFKPYETEWKFAVLRQSSIDKMNEGVLRVKCNQRMCPVLRDILTTTELQQALKGLPEPECVGCLCDVAESFQENDVTCVESNPSAAIANYEEAVRHYLDEYKLIRAQIDKDNEKLLIDLEAKQERAYQLGQLAETLGHVFNLPCVTPTKKDMTIANKIIGAMVADSQGADELLTYLRKEDDEINKKISEEQRKVIQEGINAV